MIRLFLSSFQLPAGFVSVRWNLRNSALGFLAASSGWIAPAATALEQALRILAMSIGIAAGLYSLLNAHRAWHSCPLTKAGRTCPLLTTKREDDE